MSDLECPYRRFARHQGLTKMGRGEPVQERSGFRGFLKRSTHKCPHSVQYWSRSPSHRLIVAVRVGLELPNLMTLIDGSPASMLFLIFQRHDPSSCPLVHPVLDYFFWEVVAGLAALLRGGSRGESTPFARAQILESQPQRGACFGVPGFPEKGIVASIGDSPNRSNWQ